MQGRFQASMHIGGAVAPLVAAWIIDSVVGWRGTFVIFGGVGLVWAALLIESHRAALAGSTWASGPWNTWLMSFSDILLFFGGLLTYVATALFALSLRRAQLIGAGASLAFLVINMVFALCLIVRGIDFPDPAVVFAQGYTIPGWIAGIPAVPWFMPCIFGLVLLRRIGRGRKPSVLTCGNPGRPQGPGRKGLGREAGGTTPNPRKCRNRLTDAAPARITP